MQRPALFRRRQVWLPTLWGWLLLFAATGALAILAGRNLHAFLAPTAPAPGATLLVIEGWMEDGPLDDALAIAQSGRYRRIVTSGGPIERWHEQLGARTHAEFAANHLRGRGLAGVVAVPAPASAQDRSFLSAVMVREWARRENLPLAALDVVTGGPHARRTRMIYRAAFGPGVAIGVISTPSRDFDAGHWWRTSAGAKAVLFETIAAAWTACCFRAPPPGSHEERWAVSRSDAPVR